MWVAGWRTGAFCSSQAAMMQLGVPLRGADRAVLARCPKACMRDGSETGEGVEYAVLPGGTGGQDIELQSSGNKPVFA